MSTTFRSVAGVVAATAILCWLSDTAGAFGNSGHRVIGTLAELHLRDSRAMNEVRKILRSNETLADAAVWPDRIKDAVYEDEDTAMFRLNHPAHETYHYANLPFQSTQYTLSVTGARPTDIVQSARLCIEVLSTGKGPFTRREALRLLVHYLGDMHQPLHVGNAFITAREPLQFIVPEDPTRWRTTLGGNALVYGPEDRFNLHSYWDSHAVNLAMRQDDVPTFSARLMKELQPSASWRGRGASPGEWVGQWATEGLGHAKEVHRGIRVVSYLGPDAEKRVAHRWLIEQPSDYDARAVPLVRQQLAVAGYRVATVLRSIWPD
jgi:hypothetical protein